MATTTLSSARGSENGKLLVPVKEGFVTCTATYKKSSSQAVNPVILFITTFGLPEFASAPCAPAVFAPCARATVAHSVRQTERQTVYSSNIAANTLRAFLPMRHSFCIAESRKAGPN